MQTTIKVSKDTKDRLLSLDIAKKGKTFDMVVNDLAAYYESWEKQKEKNYQSWKKDNKKFHSNLLEYDKEKAMRDRLLKWAKRKGIKG